MNRKYQEELTNIVKHTFLSVVDYHTDTQKIIFMISDKSSDELRIIESTYEDTMKYSKEFLLDEGYAKVFELMLDIENLDIMVEKGEMEKAFVIRSRLNPKDEYRWMKAHVVILEKKENGYHLSGSFEDVTELKQEEQRQKRINNYRMKALKNAFEELYIIDLEKNIFKAFNINEINELRHPMGEFLEQDIKKVIKYHVHPEDQQFVSRHVAKQYLKKQFASGKKEINLEYRLRYDLVQPYRWMYATITRLEDDTQNFAFMLIKDITEEKQASELRVQYKVLKEQMDVQIHHYEYVKEKENELRAFRHDLKNHLLVLESMHDEKRDQDFKDYINSMRGYLLKDKHFIDTGNAIMDALLNEKFAYSNMLGIEVKHHIRVIPNLPLTVMDTCILLGNSLDNAIEACENMKKGEERQITFSMIYSHHTLIIKVMNTVSKEIHEKGITFETSKEDRDLHGMGIRNMKKIVQIHEGLFSIKAEDNHVILQLTLFI